MCRGDERLYKKERICNRQYWSNVNSEQDEGKYTKTVQTCDKREKEQKKVLVVMKISDKQKDEKEGQKRDGWVQLRMT